MLIMVTMIYLKFWPLDMWAWWEGHIGWHFEAWVTLGKILCPQKWFSIANCHKLMLVMLLIVQACQSWGSKLLEALHSRGRVWKYFHNNSANLIRACQSQYWRVRPTLSPTAVQHKHPRAPPVVGHFEDSPETAHVWLQSTWWGHLFAPTVLLVVRYATCLWTVMVVCSGRLGWPGGFQLGGF